MRLAPQAAPYEAEGRRDAEGRLIGVLLCHGFTGSPASMTPWGRHLAEQGYAVCVPRLPGHGTSWQEMSRTTFADWYAEVERALLALSGRCDAVVVAGLSMGGTLALRLAEEHGDLVAGLVLVNAAVASESKQLLAVPLLKHLVPSMPGLADDIKKEGVTEHGYDRTPLRPLHSMMRAWRRVREDLGRVTCPVLLFRSAEDHVVDPSSARIILSSISSVEATEVVLENSFHVATLDHDAPLIAERSTAFVERVAGVGAR